MSKERITLNMSAIEAVKAVSEGNPGAVRVCVEAIQDGAKIDPQSALGGLSVLFSFDTHGIYGGRIWCLYKDVCLESLVDMLGVLRAVQLGHLSEKKLNLAIDGDRSAVDVPAELAFVRDELENFQRAAPDMAAT